MDTRYMEIPVVVMAAVLVAAAGVHYGWNRRVRSLYI